MGDDRTIIRECESMHCHVDVAAAVAAVDVPQVPLIDGNIEN